MAQRFRIVAIVQVYNELRRGNLRRFLDHVKPLVDELVIYDNGSTDGSWVYLQNVTPHLLRGLRNDFVNERAIRQQLLDKALTLRPDFILWLDADEILTANANQELQRAAQYCLDHNADGVALHELNLWRSGTWRRTDNAYDDGWFVRLWRVNPGLKFDSAKTGLHQQLFPESLTEICRYEPLSVIHYGFSSDEQILFKYLNYRCHGQSGWELERLIDESTLKLEQLTPELLPADLRASDQRPTSHPLTWWFNEARRRESELLRPTVSIVALIYKSTKWLKFSYEHILRYANLDDVEILFIANDAAEHVKKYLQNYYIPHLVYENTPEQKQEHYINNVYRAWNFGGFQAKGEYVLFVNSDMTFTPNWVEKLLQRIDGYNCVAARLVESGKMPSGLHGLSKNFGRTVDEYDHASFLRYARSIEKDELHDSGLFMPLLIKKNDFVGVGGYPEGNVVPDSDPFHPVIAKPGEPLTSGDVVLMDKLKQHGIIHQTDFKTISYHFQEGEMDDAADPMNQVKPTKVVVANDWLQGRMGERTMWNVLVDGLPSTAGVDQAIIGEGVGYEQRIRRFIYKNYNAPVVVQNATFMSLVDGNLSTVVILQDDLRRMERPLDQQEENLKNATVRVTNSLLTARSYPEYNFEIIPLGVDEKLFSPSDKKTARQKFNLPLEKQIAIFVGDLSPVKGWDEVRQLIQQRNDIHWIVVSKSEEKFTAPNVTMFNRVDQKTLAGLYNAADVFVIGSPVETQCLAAIEAGFCNRPIVMHNTGIFWGMLDETKKKLGWFGENLATGLEAVLTSPGSFSPRATLLAEKLTSADMVQRWHTLLVNVISADDQAKVIQAATPLSAKARRMALKISKSTFAGAHRGIKKVGKAMLPKKLADDLYMRLYDRRSRKRR